MLDGYSAHSAMIQLPNIAPFLSNVASFEVDSKNINIKCQ